MSLCLVCLSDDESAEIMRLLLNIWQYLEPDSHFLFFGNNIFCHSEYDYCSHIKGSGSNSVLISQPFLSLGLCS